MKTTELVFKSDEFGQVRTIQIDGELYFVGEEIAEILGYKNLNEAISDHVDSEDKLNIKTLSSLDVNLGQRGGWLINESGLYSLIISSKLPTAKKFKHWITSDVLSAIHKYVVYAMDEMLENPDTLIAAI